MVRVNKKLGSHGLHSFLYLVAPSYVTQVRTIFQPHLPPRSKLEIPPYLVQPLLYIQPFHVTRTPEEDPNLDMWILKRNIVQSADSGGDLHEGVIIPLQWVSHSVELVPLFGSGPLQSTVTSQTLQEVYNSFILNHFADKETYNAIHGHSDNGFLNTEYEGEPEE